MKPRPFWIERLRAGWASRPVVWLAGVRRVGKTTLARMLDDAIYVNCDLPSSARRLEDPEVFYRGLPGNATVVLDSTRSTQTAWTLIPSGLSPGLSQGPQLPRLSRGGGGL